MNNTTAGERGKPADSKGEALRGELTSLLEEDLGSDGETGRASNSQSWVNLTTETLLLNDREQTHTTHILIASAQKAALCVIIAPQTQDYTNNSYQREKEKGEKEENKWEETEGQKLETEDSQYLKSFMSYMYNKQTQTNVSS